MKFLRNTNFNLKKIFIEKNFLDPTGLYSTGFHLGTVFIKENLLDFPKISFLSKNCIKY
jgi:hypothetical protein